MIRRPVQVILLAGFLAALPAQAGLERRGTAPHWALDAPAGRTIDPLAAARADADLAVERPAGASVGQPQPSGLSLLLGALAAFGAMHGIRTAKNGSLALTPDWYHSDARPLGPVQPLDLSFAPVACLWAPFERLVVPARLTRRPPTRDVGGEVRIVLPCYARPPPVSG